MHLTCEKVQKKQSEEERASVINPNHTEIDDALPDLIQQFDETDLDRKKESEEKNVKKEEDLVKVQEIRKKYLSKLSAKQET